MDAKNLFRILVMSSFVLSENSNADWTRLGVFAMCAADGKSFLLAPMVETSESTYDIVPPVGAHRFKADEGEHYQCRVGAESVEVTLRVFSPQDRGQGQGTGGVIISAFSVGKAEIITKPTNFNWTVNSDRVLTKIEVTNHGNGVGWSLCYSNGWDWFEPYAEEQCESGGVR